jgi:hydroxymethylglutaryl-CoA synthase
MDSDVSVEAYGTHVPRLRVEPSEFEEAWGSFDARGVEEKRVPDADEDTVTMAVEAVEDALGRSSYSKDEVGTLVLGTTTPPLEEGEVGAQVAEIVGFDRSVEVIAHTQSACSGVRSLLTAASSAEENGGTAVAVASDCPLGSPDGSIDHAGGAGAVAFVVGDEGSVSVENTASYTQEFSGTRFRERGEKTVEKYGATAYERDAYTTVVSEAFEAINASDAVLAPTAPDADLPYRAGKAVGTDVYETAASLGDTGAASALFGVLEAWRNDEDDVIAVGYGDGASADAGRLVGSLSGDWERKKATKNITYTEYLRRRGHVVDERGDA